MKKSIVLAVLGGAMAAATSSFGQGQVAFNSYAAQPFPTPTVFLVGGAAVPDGFSAQLYYALGTVADPVTEGNAQSILSSITGLTAVGAAQVYNSNAGSSGAYPGYFTGATIAIPGYTGGAISFEVLTTGTVGATSYQGRSGAWTMASGINVGAAAPGTIMTGFPGFQVAAVPEPTTLALAGLGGLASLVALRRKQA